MTISLALLLKALWTGMAGAAGAGARHVVAAQSRRRFGDRFPWGTLFINLTGALLIGIIVAYLDHHHAMTQWHAPLVLGFLGGYTTFSTFMLEMARLRERSAPRHLAIYLAASIIFGPLVAFGGLVIGKLL